MHLKCLAERDEKPELAIFTPPKLRRPKISSVVLALWQAPRLKVSLLYLVLIIMKSSWTQEPKSQQQNQPSLFAKTTPAYQNTAFF